MADEDVFAPPASPTPPTPVPQVDRNLTQEGLSHQVAASSGMFNPDGSLKIPPEFAAPVPVAPQAAPPALEAPHPLARGLVPEPAPAPEPEPAPEPGSSEPAVEAPPKERHAWATLRSKAKEAEAKLEQVQAEFEQQKPKINELMTEIEERDRKIKELEDNLGRTNLEATPAFREKYTRQQQALVTRTAKALEIYAGLSAEDAKATAQDVLSSDPRSVARKVKDLDPSIAGLVLTASAEAVALTEQRQQELQEWRDTMAATVQDEARRNMVVEVKERRAMADAAIAKIAEAGVELYRTEDPSLVELSTKAIESFRGFAQSATADQLMELAAAGNVLPHYQEALQWYVNKVEALEKTLKDRGYAERRPGFEPSPPPPPPPQPMPRPGEPGSDPLKFAEELANQTLAGMRQSFQQQ